MHTTSFQLGDNVGIGLDVLKSLNDFVCLLGITHARSRSIYRFYIYSHMCSNVGTYVLSVNSSFICHCNAIYCIVSGLLFSFSRSNGPLQYISRMPCCSILSVKGKI